MTGYFIKKAIRHKGSLRAWAKKHHFLGKGGRINLSRAHAYAKRNGLEHRVKQINLAKNLRRLRKR